jgi:histidinol-phosphate aminotransferase
MERIAHRGERDIFRGSIRDMQAYSPPLEGRTKEGFLRLDFNERTIPPHPLVQEAVDQYTERGEFQVYPEYGDLNNVIAEYVGVEPSEVIATNGSDQAIDIIYRAIVEKGDAVIIPSPTFAMLEQSARIQGAKIIAPSYKGENLDFPFDEVMDGIKPGVKLVIICNPNNPTGTILSKGKSEAIIEKAEKTGAAVLVDEAYSEFAPELTVVDLIKKYNSLFVTRSFSKVMGASGLRAGCVVSQKRNIKELQKIRGPYDVNMTAAVAMKALRHPEVVDDIKKYISEVMEVSKPMLEQFYKENNIKFYPSGAGFHLLKDDGLSEFLKSKGILTRPRSNPKGTVRVSIGTREDTRKYIEAFREHLSSSR